ncbi:hypothetical protein [Novosphingobium huizhouense]|uniref:hypothetical protein n=1 Tax=Novosphingobium huizhouense TaxID=2866625 RepID=UPI001CD82090|nr:hypothetical protein [Novosphingobium huizhouense]
MTNPSDKPLFTGNLEPIGVGQEEAISFDWINRLPQGATAVEAWPVMLSGGDCATVDRVTVAGTVVRFWIKGLKPGLARFDMVVRGSDGSKEGPRVSLRVR